MTTLERKRAMESLIFLNKKRDGETVKARMGANGSTQGVESSAKLAEPIARFDDAVYDYSCIVTI
jgi:hypothetical protein